MSHVYAPSLPSSILHYFAFINITYNLCEYSIYSMGEETGDFSFDCLLAILEKKKQNMFLVLINQFRKKFRIGIS